ncbi:hypothetical protein [Polyangium sp. y55x31]|uniref:hypothetical protein n=1 Tax=Polyangium sp. y55x31 TaxID=3042688 RepID=UPI002482D656|nr:hypothetical protein [Polyangium sp. y55x31]MDI1475907.1 hypothetical protein [Polyangium sp. y55x31]
MNLHVPYLGFPNHVRLASDTVELLLSTDYGPRIIRYAPLGGDNILAEMPPGAGQPTPFGEPWHPYGGHRLWHAPEHPERTYWPDNRPLASSMDGDTVTVVQPMEENTRLQKSMRVRLGPRGSEVRIVHRIENQGAFDVELALWALTVMAAGGTGIFPQSPFRPFPEQLTPARPLVLWPYTRLHDPRWTFGDHLFLLRQDPQRSDPQKIGFYNEEGWIAYRRRDVLFVKRYAHLPGPHADFGCNTETFTNADMLELETLSPLVRIAPGGWAEHEERWYLFTGIDFGEGMEGMEAALNRAIALTNPVGE